MRMAVLADGMQEAASARRVTVPPSWDFSGDAENAGANSGAEVKPRLVQLIQTGSNGSEQPGLFRLYENPKCARKADACRSCVSSRASDMPRRQCVKSGWPWTKCGG